MWQRDKPQTFGWSQTQASAVSGSFSTTAVYQPQTAEESTARDIQLHFTIKNGQAEVTTTKAFRHGGYVWFSRGETCLIKNILLDGIYRRVSGSQTGR